MRQTQSKWDEWSQVSSLLGIQTLNLNFQLECDEWKYVRWQNNERWRAFESQMAKETEMAFFIRPQAHNLHTNRSGVRKCQRRYQNEIIFYHFLLSSNGSQRFTFHCWLFLSSTVGRISRVWMCVCMPNNRTWHLPFRCVQCTHAWAKCCSQIKIYMFDWRMFPTILLNSKHELNGTPDESEIEGVVRWHGGSMSHTKTQT